MTPETTCDGTINILSAPPGREQLVEIFRKNPPRSPLPAFADKRWEAVLARPVAARTCALLSKQAQAEADEKLPQLTDALYREFALSGTRINFERVYFERRRRLARAAIALLASPSKPDARILRSFLDKLEDIFDEVSWALPAHVHNPTGRDPDMIDLFAAETANLMGECLSVFAALIPAQLQKRIRAKLREKFFQNYLQRDYFWIHCNNNWNAVCNQGVLGAALAVEEDAGLLADMFMQASASLTQFLSGFGADGACSEGPGYWSYGFGWFALLEEQLQTRTRGLLSVFHDDPHIAAIAGYGPAMSLQDGRLVNFSDCGPDARLNPALLQYLGARLHDETYLQLARTLYGRLARQPAEINQPRADLLYWLRLFLREPALTADTPATPAPRRDSYYPSLGVWVVSGHDKHGNLWELAAKGGHNAEHHNHNDVGSFMLKVNSQSVLAELGTPEYTRDYFSPKRYENLVARTLGHSLPLINGEEQAGGAEFFGTVLHCDINQDEVGIEIELAQTYPASAHCRNFIRQLRLDKVTGIVRCTDLLSLSEPGAIESGFIFTHPDLEIASPTQLTLKTGETQVEIKCDEGNRWDRIEPHPYRSHKAELMTCYRAVLLPAVRKPQTKFKQSLTIRLHPAH